METARLPTHPESSFHPDRWHTIVFLISQRYFHRLGRRRDRWGVAITKMALAAIITIASMAIGIETYLMIQISVTLIAGAAGLWLFYVHHRFDGTY